MGNLTIRKAGLLLHAFAGCACCNFGSGHKKGTQATLSCQHCWHPPAACWSNSLCLSHQRMPSHDARDCRITWSCKHQTGQGRALTRIPTCDLYA